MISVTLFQWLKDQCSFLGVRRENGDSLCVFLVGTERCVSAGKQTCRTSSLLPYFFIVPHCILWIDEKKVCYVLRWSADLPPEAHSYKAELAFANKTPPIGESPNASSWRIIAVPMDWPVHVPEWPLTCSLQHGMLQSGMEPHRWPWLCGWEANWPLLRHWGGDVGRFGEIKHTSIWLNKFEVNYVTNLLWKPGRAKCSQPDFPHS